VRSSGPSTARRLAFWGGRFGLATKCSRSGGRFEAKRDRESALNVKRGGAETAEFDFEILCDLSGRRVDCLVLREFLD